MADKEINEETETLDILGAPGLKQFSGKISEEFLPDLKGDKRVRMFREMADNEPVISGVLYAIRTLCRQTAFDIREAEDTPEAKEAAEFISSCLFDDMDQTWTDTLSSRRRATACGTSRVKSFCSSGPMLTRITPRGALSSAAHTRVITTRRRSRHTRRSVYLET